MRLNYYRFPESVSDDIKVAEGCGVVLKRGDTIYPDSIPDDKRHLIERVEDVLEGISVTAAKKMLRQYGGSAWTEHIDRDGGCFDVTPIYLSGNNSRFKYNHHL